MKQENDFDQSSSGYRPMSYEKAANVRRRSGFDRETVRDGSDNTRPYNPFTRLGDRPKQRKVGQILALMGSVALLLTFLIFLTAEDGDYKILSMERTEGIVDSLLYVSENKSESSIVKLKYTYKGETYNKMVTLSKPSAVEETVSVYVKKHNPTDVTDAALMPQRLDDTATGFYFIEIFFIIVGGSCIANSYEHIRVQLGEINARSNAAKSSFIRH